MNCCNKQLKINKSSDGVSWMQCETCGKKGKGKTQKEAEKMFNQSSPTNNGVVARVVNARIEPMPQNKDLITWSEKNMPALMNQSAQFIDKPATQRMIEKNIRYVSQLSGNAWDKIWKTPEGQESISNALGEANYYAATLGEMGDLVPFGSSCEFIPNVECYKFGLETGNNAPFRDISIDLVHEHDQTSNEQKDSNFIFTLTRGIPRGEVIAVVVQAVRMDSGKNIGEIYDADRLMEKAKEHSPGYKNFLREKEAFTILQTSGKLDKDKVGRDCIIEKIEYYDKVSKGKKSFEKYTYESDLKNPYDGADRPEMLRKSAGKSFFRPYMKVRNATAMSDEWNGEEVETIEQAADSVLDNAMSQFKDKNIIDGEIIETENNNQEVKSDEKILNQNQKPENKEKVEPNKKNQEDFFNEDENENE